MVAIEHSTPTALTRGLERALDTQRIKRLGNAMLIAIPLILIAAAAQAALASAGLERRSSPLVFASLAAMLAPCAMST